MDIVLITLHFLVHGMGSSQPAPSANDQYNDLHIRAFVCEYEHQLYNIFHHWLRYGKEAATVVYAAYANQTNTNGYPMCYSIYSLSVSEEDLVAYYQAKHATKAGELDVAYFYRIHDTPTSGWHVLVTGEKLERSQVMSNLGTPTD